MKWIPLFLLALVGCDDSESLADAGVTQDAELDGTADSRPLDLGQDARGVDGAVHDRGAVDASLPDASLPDASLPDASLPDASLPDAALCEIWPNAPWQQPINAAALHPRSAEMIAWLNDQGWGLGRMQIDFSLEVLHAPDDLAPMAFEPSNAHFDPDCDLDPVPIPAGGALEGERGYACEDDGDCHLIVYQGTKLYEMWRADIRGDVFNGGCLAVWDTTAAYPETWRGEQCTSADAAGLPIAPLLFTADEVAAGMIDHGIRFILPNDRIQNRAYVRPGTHATGAASGGELAPPYGARLRLRADYPIEDLSAGAQVVARAMQTYGMFLADGGRVTLTGQSDRFTQAKWDGLMGPHDLRPLQVSDFEVVDSGPVFRWTGDCVRSEAPMVCE